MPVLAVLVVIVLAILALIIATGVVRRRRSETARRIRPDGTDVSLFTGTTFVEGGHRHHDAGGHHAGGAHGGH